MAIELSEMKKCNECGEMLPISAFRLKKDGTPYDTCQSCIHKNRLYTVELNKAALSTPKRYCDEELDKLQPVQVINIINRCRHLLNARSYNCNVEIEHIKVTRIKLD